MIKLPAAFVTSNGFGKRSSAYEYRISNRGGKGITGILTTPKNGKVIDSFVVNEKDQIILVSNQGQIIRININQVRIAGRTTQGVSIFKIPDQELYYKIRLPFQKHKPAVIRPNHPAVDLLTANQPANRRQ